MSHTVTGNPTSNPSSAIVPDDGDRPFAADVSEPVQALFDKSEYIIQGDTVFTGEKTFPAVSNISGNPPAWTLTAAPVFTRVVIGRPVDDAGSVAQNYPLVLDVGSGSYLEWPLDLPNGAVLATISVRIDPAAATVATNRVSAVVYEYSRGGTITVGSIIPDPATGASYLAAHDAEFGGLAVTVDNGDKAYFFVLLAENGGSAANVAILGPPFVTYLLPAIDFGR